MLLVAELIVLLIQQFLESLDHLGGSLSHLLGLLLMRLIVGVLLRLNSVVEYLVLTQILVGELPLAEFLDDSILLSIVFECFIELFPDLSYLALVEFGILSATFILSHTDSGA